MNQSGNKRIEMLAHGPVGRSLFARQDAEVITMGTEAMRLMSLVLIPLVIILPRFFGLTGAFAALPAGSLMAFLMGLVLMRRTLRKLDEGDATAKPVPATVV